MQMSAFGTVGAQLVVDAVFAWSTPAAKHTISDDIGIGAFDFGVGWIVENVF